MKTNQNNPKHHVFSVDLCDPVVSWRRGSTLLLVLAALLLALILGMTYLEIVRLDRKSTKNILNAGDLQDVTNSIIDLIAQRLWEDLGIDNNNTFFTTGDGQEPYDYPGDKDKWLASTAVEVPVPPTTPTSFAQITLLNETFYDGNLVSTDTVQTNFFAEDATVPGYVTGPARNVGMGVFESAPADADGDSIADSKAQVAPIASLNGVNYYMWVRIIDNSSMLNLNTALALTDGTTVGGVPNFASGIDGPNFSSPSELDVSFLHHELTLPKGIQINELRDFLGRRLGLLAPYVGALYTTWPNRYDFWQYGASLYDNYGVNAGGTPFVKLTLANEGELRFRGGLNNHDNLAPVENDLITLTRRDVSEATFRDWIRWRYGGGGSEGPYEYFWNNSRTMLTMISGHSLFRPTRGVGETGKLLKPDLNTYTSAGTLQAATELATQIRNVLTSGTTPYTPALGGLTVVEYADQMAASIIDYADNNDTVTKVGTRYGLERLPFISEVFVQHAYLVSDTTISITVPPLNVQQAVPALGYVRQPFAGVAVEIRNPFQSKNVPLAGVKITFGAEEHLLSDLLPPGTTELAPDTALIIYQESPTGDDSHKVSERWAGTAGTVIPVALGDGTITAFESGGEVEIKMTTNESGVDAYQKVIVEAIPLHVPAPEPSATTGLMKGEYRYKQRARIGNGNRLNVITARAGDFKTAKNNDDPILGTPGSHDPSIDALNVAAKGSQGSADKFDNLITQDLLFNQRVDDRLTWTGELAQIAILGFSVTKTIPDMWNDFWHAVDKEPLYYLKLKPKATDPNLERDLTDPATIPIVLSEITDTADPTNLPAGSEDDALMHGQMILDHFTTLSPFEDGKDNDGQNGNDDAREQFLPGTINVNTAPTRLLDFLPIVDSNTYNGVIQNLPRYRRGAARVPGLRTIAGFASVGEFYNLVTHNTTPNTQGMDALDTRIEEDTVAGRWLGQVAAVRSDVYTAYILVRGYRGNSQIPEVEKRVVVLFDRSRVTGQADRPIATILTSY